MKDAISKLPIFKWRKNYNKSFIRLDTLAGITIGAFAIPEAIAYASLAGLPPQSGLYAALVAVIIYFIFGYSNQLSIGPTSALAILVGSTLGTLTIISPNNFIALGALVALITGIFGLLAWILRMGFIVKFISSTVLTGFSAGAAFFIAASQLSKLFGISGGSGEFFDRIVFIIAHIGEIHIISLIIGLIVIIYLILSEKYFAKIPNALIVVIISVVLFSFPYFQNLGVDLVGFIPTGLPIPTIPIVPSGDIGTFIGLGLACFILSYVEGMGAAQTFAWKHGDNVDGNQELLANGAANLTAGLTQGMPVGGSISRTAVNDESNSKSPISSGIAGVVLAIVIMFFASYFSALSEPVLGAIVIVAVIKLINISSFRKYFKASKIEFVFAISTFGGVLIFGMLEGIFIGVAISFISLIYNIYKPKIPELGQVPNTDIYKDIKYNKKNKRTPGLLIFRVDSSQLFINAENIRDNIMERVDKSINPVSLVILDMENTNRLDITGAEKIEELHDKLKNDGIDLKLAELIAPAREILYKLNLNDKLNINKDEYITVDQIINDWRNK